MCYLLHKTLSGLYPVLLIIDIPKGLDMSKHMHVLPLYAVLCGPEKLSLLMTIQVGKGTRKL